MSGLAISMKDGRGGEEHKKTFLPVFTTILP
jgi:hypothetical protein